MKYSIMKQRNLSFIGTLFIKLEATISKIPGQRTASELPVHRTDMIRVHGTPCTR